MKKIIAALELKPKDVVIEIGPGHGELTLPIAESCQKIGCQILAIEKDTELAKNLERKIQNLKLGGVAKVFGGDILKVLANRTNILPPLWHDIGRRRLSYKIVGNIPYYISGHLFRVIGNLKNKPSVCILTVQEEVAERLSAKPPKMNRLAAIIQFWAEPKIIGRLGEKDFSPVPKVKSAVLKLATKKSAARATPQSRRHTIKWQSYESAVKMLFAHPRKTILNNLRESCLTKERLIESLREINVSPGARPQNLDIESITKISQIL